MMADTAQEHIGLLEQRLAQVPQSPLFARLASLYVQVGRAKDALRLCDDGLAHYPFYATAHLVKGKALAELGMMAEARHEYEVVHELLPTNASVARLVSSIDIGTPEEIVSAPAADVMEEPAPQPEAPTPEEPADVPVMEEAAQPFVEEIVEESSVSSEEPVLAEEVVQPVEEAVTEDAQQEFTTEEEVPVVDDLAGFGETAVEEAPEVEPGAADKLGLEMKPEPMEPLTDTGFGAGFGEPEAAQEETPFTMPVQEEQQAATKTGLGDTFGTAEETPAEEPTVNAELTEQPSSTTDASPEQTQEPEIQEAPETAMMPPMQERTITAEPAEAESENPEWFEAFSQLQQQPAEAEPAAPVSAPAEEENPFAMFGSEQPESSSEEGESYEDYTARARMEMFGNENTMTLEEYLGQAAQAGVSAPPVDNIGELAEKLKTSPRLTPPVINFSEKASRTSSEGDAATASGILTPTLAEIYVKQGWFDDAIKAYRSLAANKPDEREKFEQRINEIEELKKNS